MTLFRTQYDWYSIEMTRLLSTLFLAWQGKTGVPREKTCRKGPLLTFDEFCLV